MKTKTCIIISGATATGKTSYSLELAGKLNTQIISADSRQCFRELNIGVAKPSPADLNRIHHYFINSHSIHEEVNVKVFEQYALNAVQAIFEKNDTAIVVGGTGLYIKSFAGGLDEVPPSDDAVRNEILVSYKKNGVEWLQGEIKKRDEKYFSEGDMKNPQRMMRALEVHCLSGKSILDFYTGKNVIRNFTIEHVHLDVPRPSLYERIDTRVDHMMEAGLLEEVKSLVSYRHLNALQTVGYKELFAYLDGNISLAEAIDLIKKNTRHFAKRQVTWFKNQLTGIQNQPLGL
ncbi:MAG: tRNA (adenosine(37)-N6)-dimethylallyltransferase MiaA [Ginsengibacter sp.]